MQERKMAMFNKRTLAIIKRELKVKLFSKSFIIMTLLVPLFMIGIFSIQYFVQSMSEEQRSDLIILSDSDDILNKIQNEIFQTNPFKSGDLTAKFEKIDLSDFQSRLKEIKPDIISQKITGVVFIPSTFLQSKEVEYYSSNPNNSSLFYKIKPSINKALVEIYFAGRLLTEDEIKFARKDVDIKGFRVSSDEKVAQEGYGNRIAMVLFVFLLYMALIFSGSMTMNAVVEEKSNKIVEVLLSSASSTELMAGKILGTVIIEVLQMSIWLSPVVLLISTSWFFIPPELMPQMSIEFIFYFLFNYTIALITYVALYATVGAIFDNPQDAQSGVWPLLISVVINIVVLVGIFKLAGKIYRIGILLTGKKPQWSEVFSWLRMS